MKLLLYFAAGPLAVLALAGLLSLASCRHLPPASFDAPTQLADGGQLGWGP